jgi:CelD/BcsL family acetyltransferase involved in cellulose biosynthesis
VHGTIDSLFRVEWRPLSELAAVTADWRELAARALEPNVFYEPSFALAAAPVFGRYAGAGLVWSRATPPRLVGFFPARIERRRYGIKLPVLVGWTHPYAPLGTPLVDRETGEVAIAAWFDHIAADPQLPDVMLLPYVPVEGAVSQALDKVVARRRGRSASFAPHQRALLFPADDRTSYLDHAIGHKKRKELRRQRKRLGEDGSVTSTDTGDPAAIPRALGDFFALEAGGWKGRAGTAAGQHADLRAFMQDAIEKLAADGHARIDRLMPASPPS